MTTTVTLRIPFKTKVALEGLATITRQSIGTVVEQAVETMLEQLSRDQRLTLESLTEHATEHTDSPPQATTPAQIWQAVNLEFIAPSRARRESGFEICVADFHKALGLTDRHSQVIRILRNKTYHDIYAVRLKSETDGKPKIFDFELREAKRG